MSMAGAMGGMGRDDWARFLPESWLTPYIPAPPRDGVQARYIQGPASHADSTDIVTDQ